ncbi:MAG: 3-deoxy-8-phosphooctulonate synthase, partial [Planctomycetota bacterium]
RTSVSSYRGLGRNAGLELLQHIRETVGVPVVSDVHAVDEVAEAAQVLDVLQIPAFLCRQTDLLIACGETGKCVNLKKGQFVAPHDIRHGVEKIRSTGNARVLLTERGATFGYNNLVVDMRGLAVMQRECGVPVVFDAGHSVQSPGGQGASSGGDRGSIPVLARAAVAAGCDGIFLETHPDPDKARSDGPNSWPLGQLEPLLRQLKTLADAVRAF